MSGLPDVLAGRLAAGAYRWRAPAGGRTVEDVRTATEGAGWRYAHLAGASLTTKAELIAALGDALGLTGLHGRNLDALEECVRELRSPTLLLWEGWGPLARADARAFRGVTAVLTETRDRAGCWVLLPGDGPDLDLPTLG